MRRSIPLLIASLCLAACDPVTVAALLDVPATATSGTGAASNGAPGSPGPSSAPSSAAGKAAAPKGEAYAPRDLSGETWVNEIAGGFEIAGDRLTITATKGKRLLFYRPPLGQTFALGFTERREAVNGDLVVRWMLDPGDMPKRDADGNRRTFAYGLLTLRANGEVLVQAGGKKALHKDLPAERRWELAVDGHDTVIKLNGEVLQTLTLPPGYHPAPYIAFEARVTRAQPMTLEGVEVSSSPAGDRHAVIRQWDITSDEAGPQRFTMIHASDVPRLPAPGALDTVPAMLKHVVAVGGYPLDRHSALVYARTDGFSGGTYGGNGIYLAPTFMNANGVTGHEMAHGYGYGGTRNTRRPADGSGGWLVEGLADYVGNAAYQSYLGRPVWRAARVSKLPPYDPPLSEAHAATQARGGNAVKWKIYTKGRLFLSLLAAHTSPQDLSAVIAANKGSKTVSGEGFVAALEARTGKDLAHLRPGWLVEGAYAGPGPADADDTDGDGLLDFQELAWGTRVNEADTDGDGANDYAERAAGTDALSPLEKPLQAINGLVGGIGWSLGTEEAEATPDESDAERLDEALELE